MAGVGSVGQRQCEEGVACATSMAWISDEELAGELRRIYRPTHTSCAVITEHGHRAVDWVQRLENELGSERRGQWQHFGRVGQE